MAEISDREKALLDIINGHTPMCPHLFRVPADGRHGPQTCVGGCHEEPCSTSGPYPIFEFEDLVHELQVGMVNNTIEHLPLDDTEHPSIAWWKEHTGEDLLA